MRVVFLGGCGTRSVWVLGCLLFVNGVCGCGDVVLRGRLVGDCEPVKCAGCARVSVSCLARLLGGWDG